MKLALRFENFDSNSISGIFSCYLPHEKNGSYYHLFCGDKYKMDEVREKCDGKVNTLIQSIFDRRNNSGNRFLALIRPNVENLESIFLFPGDRVKIQNIIFGEGDEEKITFINKNLDGLTYSIFVRLFNEYTGLYLLGEEYVKCTTRNLPYIVIDSFNLMKSCDKDNKELYSSAKNILSDALDKTGFEADMPKITGLCNIDENEAKKILDFYILKYILFSRNDYKGVEQMQKVIRLDEEKSFSEIDIPNFKVGGTE